MAYTEQRTALFELPELFLEVGIVRLQDAILDIMEEAPPMAKNFLPPSS